MTKLRSILRLEMSYRKMPIGEAIALLEDERRRGATHATVKIRWEEPKPDKK